MKKWHSKKLACRYKVLIADEDQAVHDGIRQALGNFDFKKMGLEFLDTYNSEETKNVFEKEDDIAVLFLDVAMGNNILGLEVIKYLRDNLKNTVTRIILKIEHQDDAPEESIIRDYDIDGYLFRTELLEKRLVMSFYTAIRYYSELYKQEKTQFQLEKIIKSSATLFENNSLDNFLESILLQLASFKDLKDDVQSSGFITMVRNNENMIVAAIGKYEPYIGMPIEEISELIHIYHYITSGCYDTSSYFTKINSGFIVRNHDRGASNNYIFVEGEEESFDYDLINLFLSNFSIALDNFILNNMINDIQNDFLLALAEAIESNFEETGHHNRRISKMMYNFSLLTYSSRKEAEILKLASSMHDLGKVIIPETILKKPGKLTVEEYEIIKTHTTHGYRILNGVDLPTFKRAAEIALNHHEKYDGTGYPGGKKGMNIPLSARMMAIVDAYDAMTNKRVYSEAISREDTVYEMLRCKGTHFDPKLLDLFLDRLDEILEVNTNQYIVSPCYSC